MKKINTFQHWPVLTPWWRSANPKGSNSLCLDAARPGPFAELTSHLADAARCW
jgi:hypothetical protein